MDIKTDWTAAEPIELKFESIWALNALLSPFKLSVHGTVELFSLEDLVNRV